MLRAPGRLLRTAVVSGRWLVIGAWVAAAFVTTFALPGDGAGGAGDIGSLLPSDSDAVAVLERSLEDFRIPALSETAVVVHDPDGLDVLTRADMVVQALATMQAAKRTPGDPGDGRVEAAIPVPMMTSDTAVTFLYTTEGIALAERMGLAQRYATHFETDPSVQTFVTGVVPAQVSQAAHLQARLHTFEIATLVLIALVVAVTFRSVVAPVVVLFAAGIGYLVSLRVLEFLAGILGFALPGQLRPLTAALLIGVVTDYCVLFISGFRRQLEGGLHRHEAARRTLLSEGPIVAVAGLTVAGGTAALLAADFQLFRAFGPALSLTVVIGLLVSLTLVPATLAVLGRALFFPRRVSTEGGGSRASARPATPGRVVTLVTRRKGAALVTAATVTVLTLAALPLLHMRLDVSFAAGLPDDDPVRRGAEVLDDAGLRGMVAPTEILVEGDGVAEQRAALAELQRSVASQPGVAAVLGPAQHPFRDEYGVLFAEDGDAARLLVFFDSDPLAAPAIADLDVLQGKLDRLLQDADVDDATVAVSGQTAIAAELVELTRHNLWLTLLAAFAVELVILVLYLRALVAPVLLLACSALGVAAALGLAVLVFQDLGGDPGLLFFVPFTTAVLLLALGSDYNVFAVGSIWKEAARCPLHQAIARALPSTGRAISAAGLILAVTFAMVAIIPLDSFRQLAFVMAVGLLLDTFLIRPLLTPALLTRLGRAASWPSRRILTAGHPRPAREARPRSWPRGPDP
ncbi:putative drug exporter of the RND superfamily [Blastococcus aggregatus]|uniref:Putative drug exporter of the RND superfamily n=1 Tax=Blastococcus aggregatus TaxID=38502 RepID=A0A285V913_9ACTN|nr:MMPL family transporter [Blastococcus aggregatus]SOC50068.1 putative drug exporter of the RND superfamily [Blastococcus aggregatus]